MTGTENVTEQRIAEIQRMIEEFQDNFKKGTSDPDHFITMSEIEHMWSQLKNDTEKIYSDMVMELMANVDEDALISKKNRISGKSESD